MTNPLFIKLGIAVLVGGIIGFEREYHYKAAGFRTIILITIGSTLYTLFSISIAGDIDTVLVSAGVALIVLLIFPRVVSWINKIRDARTYKIVIGTGNIDDLEKLKQSFSDCHLLVSKDHMQISEASITSSWRI